MSFSLIFSSRKLASAPESAACAAHQLRYFAIHSGRTIVAEYIDHESGRISDREQFEAMFDAASKRQFDVLLFWSLDRLSREGVLPTLRHLQRLTSYGVGYRSFSEQYFDPCGIFRDAVIAIIATVAKQERIRISERVRAGLSTARNKGKRLGRPRVFVPRARIETLRQEGKSWREIAQELNLNTATVRSVRRDYPGAPVSFISPLSSRAGTKMQPAFLFPDRRNVERDKNLSPCCLVSD